MAKIKYILEDAHHIGVLLQDRAIKGREIVFEVSEDMAKLLIDRLVSLHGFTPVEDPAMVPVEHAQSAQEREARESVENKAQLIERAAEVPALQEPKRAEPIAPKSPVDVVDERGFVVEAPVAPEVIEDHAEGHHMEYVKDPHKSPARASNLAGMKVEEDAKKSLDEQGFVSEEEAVRDEKREEKKPAPKSQSHQSKQAHKDSK